MLHKTLLFLTLLLPHLAISLPQQSQPPPETIPSPKVKNVTYTGHGCQEPDSLRFAYYTWRFTNYTQYFQQYLTDFGPYSGPGVPQSWKRRRCNVVVEFEYDPGWKIRVNHKGTEVQGLGRLEQTTSKLDYLVEFGWGGVDAKVSRKERNRSWTYDVDFGQC